MKIHIRLLREKIAQEYDELKDILEKAIENSEVDADTFLEYPEYFFIKSRIYICFHDFPEYINADNRITEFLLKCRNASDYLTCIYLNGLAGDCDVKSVEGIEKLMIFAYNHAVFQNGKCDFIPVEVTF